jgi:hypothetical protein
MKESPNAALWNKNEGVVGILPAFYRTEEDACKNAHAPILKNPSSPGIWMNLQLDYEFMRADREKGEAIRKEVPPSAA